MKHSPGELLSDRVHGEIIHRFKMDIDPPKGTHQGSAKVVKHPKTGKTLVVRTKGSAGYKAMKLYLYLLRYYRPKTILTPPLGLSVAWIHKVPQRLRKKLIESGQEFIFHQSIPDNSNVIKIIEDAMTKAGFWEDDAKISDHNLRKRYALKARVEVTIYRPGL